MRDPLQSPRSLSPSAVLALAFFGYALLAAALLHPIAAQLTTRVPHDLGDPLLTTTLMWWNTQALPLTERWLNGFFFTPAPGIISFSDHRLGQSLFASPLISLGLSPLAAYNLTLLLTFPLCAIAAHALVYVLTRRHDAALVAGLAYGFSPYRVAHLEHLELLAAYGMPAALACLHAYDTDRRIRWLLLFAGALVLQALSCTYYSLFFFVMLGLWLAWFVRKGDRDLVIGVAGASLATVAILAPLAWLYRSAHQQYGFTRGLNDIVTLSADVTSYVTASPLVSVWGWTSTLNGPERQLMPGAALALLVVAGVVTSWRSEKRGWRLAAAGFAVAAGFGTIAAVTIARGPWRVALGPLSVSGTTAFKPLSLAFVALVAAIAALPQTREAYRRRSAFAFYTFAAIALALFSLGPKPAILGEQFLYEPPYAWLMRISIFGESVRVPARFAMLVILSLSTAAALAYARLTSTWRWRPAVLAAVAGAIMLETWVKDVPMFEPPAPWPAPVTAAGAVSFVDLPIGDVFHEAAAMYRAMQTGLPTANGNSGFYPPHYDVLRLATEERDETALLALAVRGPLLVAVDRQAPAEAALVAWLKDLPTASAVASDSQRAWFLVRPSTRDSAACPDPPLPVASIRDREGRNVTAMLTDSDPATAWTTREAQHQGDALIVDLGRPVRACGVELALGPQAGLFPRLLSIATSLDGEDWQVSVTEKTGGRTLLAAVASPRNARLAFVLTPVTARYVRLQLEAPIAKTPWVAADLSITGSPQE